MNTGQSCCMNADREVGKFIFQNINKLAFSSSFYGKGHRKNKEK